MSTAFAGTSWSQSAASYWPNAQQLRLLKAALLTGPAALEAWQQWQAAVDVDTVDVGTQRLLPLLAHNLRAQGVSDDDLARFKGLLRYTWAANQRRMMQVGPVVAALHAASIPTMLLKGMALAQHYYQNVGLRPMDDVDLLVPFESAHQAIDVLRRLSWRPLGANADPALGHARSFVHSSGCQIDLHWHSQWEFCGRDDDAEIWAHSETATIGRTHVRVVSAADLLLQTIVHGCRWNSVPPIRWVADALLVVRQQEHRVEWPRFVSQVRAHQLVLPVRRALEFLVEAFAAPVPADVISNLQDYRAQSFERIEQRMREWTSPAVGCFPLVICHHVRLTRRDGVLRMASRLPRYLQYTYDLPSLRALPGALYTRAARRLKAATAPS
ncbi:MAG: nucleotidyltransferase family protein [Vicinamibacterales bacterium]